MSPGFSTVNNNPYSLASQSTVSSLAIQFKYEFALLFYNKRDNYSLVHFCVHTDDLAVLDDDFRYVEGGGVF